MKQPEITKRWIEAGKILAADPAAKVRCPACDDDFLVVTDIPIEGTAKFERLLSCPRCHSKNVLLMNKKA